jgi:cytochrome c peroxidase
MRREEEPVSAKTVLGQALFFDPILSSTGTVACSSCHRLAEGGDDGETKSKGANGALQEFNTPTIYNVARNFRLNWRGNVRRLEDQVERILLHPNVMGTTWVELLQKLKTGAKYKDQFTRAYGSGPDRETILDALARYQRTLLTPNSRFDRFLRHEPGALTEQERQGYELFKSYGCASCHQGENIGGNLFQKFGVFAGPEHTKSPSDLGRFWDTARESDKYVFRVPSLRNVAVTAPYFHDGSVQSLDDAVRVMSQFQLGRDLPNDDVTKIVSFLRSLTGEFQGQPLVSASGSRNGSD